MKKKYLISAGGAGILCAGILLFTRGFLHYEKPEADISIGRVLLTELEEQKTEDVQASIQTVQNARAEAARLQREAEEAALQAQHEAEAAAQAAADEAARAAYFQQWCDEADAMADADQFKSIFSTSVVLGDSIAQGIIQTDLMLSTSVVSKIGGNTQDFLDYVPQVQSLNPTHIFLYCGFNDIGMCYGNLDKYYRDFSTLVVQLQAACPGVPIYVNHLIPVISTEFLESENYWDVPVYNEIIDRIASDYGLTVIETSDLIRQEYYYKDGYHMIYPYYPKWLRRMAEAGGLM